MKYVTPTLLLCTLLSLPAGARGQTQPGADDAASAAARLAPRASVAAVMKNAGQALIWDTEAGQYVVVRKGDRFRDFRVTAIRPDAVVLSRPGAQTVHYVLPVVAEPDLDKDGGSLGLLDPYPVLSPLDPYGEDRVVTVQAPPGARASEAPVPVVSAPAASAPPAPAGAPAATPAAPRPTPATPPTATPPATGSGITLSPPTQKPMPDAVLTPPGKTLRHGHKAPRLEAVPPPVVATGDDKRAVSEEILTISRAEFDAAMSDFSGLAREVRVALRGEGVLLEEVARGSLVYRMGLRKGDLVRRIDGQPITSLDDAAAIYARLLDAEQFVIELTRGAGSQSLRYRFGK